MLAGKLGVQWFGLTRSTGPHRIAWYKRGKDMHPAIEFIHDVLHNRSWLARLSDTLYEAKE